MERLSDWRAAAWVAFCLAALATVAALVIPAGTKDAKPRQAEPTIDATLVPRTHLFGQPVTATVVVPAGYPVRTRFTPYRVLSREVSRQGGNVRYRFVIDCLRSACVRGPGTAAAMALPPVTIGLPGGKKVVGSWPSLRQASRLGPTDLKQPVLRGDLTPPDPPKAGDHRTLLGIAFALVAALALAAAAVLGLRRLGWRPDPRWNGRGRRDPTELDYALLVTGLAAGGGPADRRAALESLALALEQRGIGDLAAEARGLAWSPRPPAGDRVRRLADKAQLRTREPA